MTNHIKKCMLSLTLAAASLFAISPVEAGIISYDFSVTIDTASALLVEKTFTGSFSFNDAQAPAIPGPGLEEFYLLQSFSFDFASELYTLADLSGDAVLLGSQFLGLEAGGPNFSFLPKIGSFPASFAYEFVTGDTGNGSITYTQLVGSVPEPSMKWLLIGGLVVLVGISRSTRGLHESV